MPAKKRQLSRRDFLKLTAATAGGALLAPIVADEKTVRGENSARPNIILLVFDAMSARHLSLYGYERETTPNISRFAQKASVYHSHYSGGNFTTSGTGSMLTGTYPWTHRAINHRGRIIPSLAARNIFNFLGNSYERIAFSHNWWVHLLLSQFEPSINNLISPTSYSTKIKHILVEDRFSKDYLTAYYAYEDALNSDSTDTPPASMLLAFREAALDKRVGKRERGGGISNYPYGPPSTEYNEFELGTVLAGMASSFPDPVKSQRPWFEYFHIIPPHQPYSPNKDFAALFQDTQGFVRKPVHPLVPDYLDDRMLLKYHSRYDQFIANVDHEFGILLDGLEKSGTLDSTYFIITSDHGEIFERGMLGHSGPLLYDAMIRIPLLIRAPGQTQRKDYYSTTSNLDLAPTILQLAGVDAPPELEGQFLPGFGAVEQPDRPVFSIQAYRNSPFKALTSASIALKQGEYKLIHYLGYAGIRDEFELYDLKNDPDELNNLYGKLNNTSLELKSALLEALTLANKPYEKANQ